MAIGPYWSYIQPVGRDNLCLNPSFERGTSGVAAIQSATLGSAANEQQFGAWSCSVAPNSNGTSGAAFGTWTAGNGTDYTVSAYVQGVNGVAYMIGVGDSNGVNLLGSTAFTGGGTWQRYSYPFTEASGATRRVVIRKTTGNDTGTFYVDAVQIEAGSITTYLDGDQEGCIWNGAPHASTSTRSGQSRAGGSVIPLASIGFNVAESLGIGMPTVENSSQSYAIVPGAEFQRQRARERTITLTSYLVGTSWGDLHQKRKAAINTFNMDAFTPQQPTRFLYTGGLGTVQIDAIYDGGMEFGKPEGFEETVSVRFVAYQPYWTATTDEGTALASRTAIGSTNYIVYRDPLGRWGTLGANGSTFATNGGPFAQVRAIEPFGNGTILMAGSWGTIAGTVHPASVAMYFPDTNKFGTLAGGTLTKAFSPWPVVYDMVITPSGSVYVAGDFGTAAGTRANSVAVWNGAWGTLTGGTLDAAGGFALAYNGTLFVGGNFSKAAGTSALFIAQWSNGAWGSLSGQNVGTLDSITRDLTFGKDGRLFIVGQFGSAAGTAANKVAYWNGAFGTLSAGVDPVAGHDAYSALVAQDGRLYVGGYLNNAGGGSANSIAVWNGVQFTSLGSGLQLPGNIPVVYKMLTDNAGNIYAGGKFNVAGGIAVSDGLAVWTGAAWHGPDIEIAGGAVGTFFSLKLMPSGTLYAGGEFYGTAQAAAVAQIVNTGAAQAYPILFSRNTGSGTARIYQFVNTLTNDSLFFDLTLLPGEEITLDLTPGARSFTSSFQGNVFGNILPGSNIATWSLLSGTNYISFFTDSDTLSNSVYWRPKHWSADSGTVY